MTREKRVSHHKRGASRSVTSSKRPLALPTSFTQKLFGWIKAMAVICILFTISLAGVWLAPKLSPEIEQVVIEGDYQWVQEVGLREVIYKNLDQGILQLEIDLLRDEIERVPWVEQAEVVREFPAVLIVRITEQQPIAQWNDQGYISHQGEFIASALYEELSHLPNLSSEHDLHNPVEGSFEAIELYHLLNSAVLVSGESITSLSRNRAGGWTMHWESGLLINLGRVEHLNRTRHALAAWRRLPDQIKEKIAEIDARYDNGVAIRLEASEAFGASGLATEQIYKTNASATSQI